MLTEIAEVTGLSRKDVGAVLDELGSIMERHLKKARRRRIYAARFIES